MSYEPFEHTCRDCNETAICARRCAPKGKAGLYTSDGILRVLEEEAPNGIPLSNRGEGAGRNSVSSASRTDKTIDPWTVAQSRCGRQEFSAELFVQKITQVSSFQGLQEARWRQSRTRQKSTFDERSQMPADLQISKTYTGSACALSTGSNEG